MKLAIKKGDIVQVIAGAQKGTRGAVLELDKQKLRVKVQGARVQTHFDKEEGILKHEGFMDYSNVKLVETVAREKTAKKKSSKSKSAQKS